MLTKPPKESNIAGLTIFDAAKLKANFKGGKINEAKGEKVLVDWEVSEIENDCIRFSNSDMKKMKANVGDLVYLCDNRTWLGGLKSIHAVYGEPHEKDGIVLINSEQQQSGLFDKERKLYGEKEM